jgi:hypothetical protein
VFVVELGSVCCSRAYAEYSARRRRGSSGAAVAIGHAILRAACHVLTDHQPYDERLLPTKPPRSTNPTHLVQKPRALGVELAIQAIEPAA